MAAPYAKLSVPRQVFDRATRVARQTGFRSTSEALLYWARQGLEEAESQLPKETLTHAHTGT